MAETPVHQQDEGKMTSAEFAAASLQEAVVSVILAQRGLPLTSVQQIWSAAARLNGRDVRGSAPRFLIQTL